MIYHVSLSIAGRQIDFSLDLDENNLCDSGIIGHLQNNKLCEPEVCQALARALKPGDVAVDGGANVGFFTILMSKLVGETGKVYAFEPGGNNLPKLARNIALNDCKNVRAIDKPLSDKPNQTVIVYEHEHGGYNSLWPDESKDVTTKRAAMTTTLFDECKGRPPRLIKLDVEGAELQALKGLKYMIQSGPIIIVEMNPATLDRSGSTLEDLRGFLDQRGYYPFMLFEDGNMPARIFRGTAIVPTRMNANVMFTTVSEVEKLWPEVFV